METPEFSVENIEKALHQLYYDPVACTKDAAQRWLMYAQRSKQAWQFAWELLRPDRLTEVQYFGASALVSKISGSWSEVPEEEIESLRDRLFSEILRLCVSAQDRIVLTRVCVAFASFVMNCAIMQKWSSAVCDIIKKLQDNAGTAATPIQRCTALLEILTVLAEEFQSRNMERHQKGIVKHMLLQGMPHALPLLSELLSTESIKETHSKVLKCLSSWMILGVPLDENVELIDKVLSCLDNPVLFENCVECLLNIFCAPNANTYTNTMKGIIPKILTLRPMFHKAIEEQDADVCLGITKIVGGLAEHQTKLILENYSNPEIGLGLVLMVAECTGIRLQYPTEEVGSPITFTFWYTLQDEVRGLPESESAIFPQIQPVYYHLVETLIRKAAYPKETPHTDWSSDEKEQHRIYRIDISDTLMFVLEMLGPPMIQFLCEKLTQTVNAMHTGHDISWQDVEALLFGIHSVVESLAEWEEDMDCLSAVVRILPTIKVDNITLADTMLYAIGALTEWVSYHPQFIAVLLPIVLPCLHTHDLALTTVLTLKRISRECEEHMQPYADSILATIQDALMKGILKNNEVNWVMQSAGHILSILPEEECLRQLQKVLMLHMHQLQALSEDPPTGPTKNSIIHILEILTSLFSTLDRRKDGEKPAVQTSHKEPVMLILEQITPILQEILNRWINDVTVVQAICDLYDRAIRNLLAGFSPLVSTLCDILAKIYQTVPQTSVLNLTEQLALVYGSDLEHENAVGSLLRSLVETSRRMFEGGHVREHPDLAQGFMKMLAFILKKKFKLYKEISGSPPLAAVDFTLLFHCGLATLVLPESESVKSACSFFFALLQCSDIAASNAVNQLGKNLLSALLKGVGGQATRTVMDNIADVMHALTKQNYYQQFAVWIHELRQAPDVPCSNIDKAKKDTFMTQLLKERAGKSKYRNLVREFTLVCRGLQGTEYAMG